LSLSLWKQASALAVLGIALMVSVRVLAAPPPVEAYATPPNAAQISLSPDGSHVGYLSPIDGQLALIIRRTQAPAEEKPVVILSGDWRVNWFEWVSNDRLLLGIIQTQMVPGPSRDLPWRFTRMVGVNRDGSAMKLLLDPRRTRRSVYYATDRVLQFVDSDHVLVSFRADDDEWVDVIKLNVTTGNYEKVAKGNPGIAGYLPDPTGEVRIAYGIDDKDQEQTYYIRSGRGESFELLKRTSLKSEADFEVLGFGSDPDTVYVSSTHEGDKAAIYTFSLTSRTFTGKVLEDPGYDINAAITRQGQVTGFTYFRDMPVQRYLNSSRQQLLEVLDKAIPDSSENIVDSTPDGRLTLLASWHPGEPLTYRLFDREKKQLAFFADTYPGLPSASIAVRQAVSFKTRDQQTIPAYLTVPPGSSGKNLPFIVLPHGGPRARDTQQFDPLSQFLVSRGYAVLQPNFRGSTGYGTAFLNAGSQQWGRRMQEDVIDGVHWAVSQGIADPKRMCIVGWSYGGYSALMGAVQSSDLFRCAIATAPVANLPRLYKELRWTRYKEISRGLFFGDDPDELKPWSPVHQAGRINIPVLLIHGDHDYQAFVQHSRDMRDALKDAGKPFEYIEIEGMDHAPHNTKDMVTILSAWERFLAQNLGPGATAGATQQ
jgi:dipeptidyl aminopeptidase/acylaminoacyl peptidase